MIFFGPSNQDNAYNLARLAIESQYDAKCDVIEYKAVKNNMNKRTEYQEEKVLKEQSCKISYETIKNSNQDEEGNSIIQIIKLFIAPEIQIKPRFKNYC